MKKLILSIFVILSPFVIFETVDKEISAYEDNDVNEISIDQDVLNDLENLNFNTYVEEYDKNELINLSVGAFDETTLDDGIDFKNTRKSNTVQERESVSLLSVEDKEIVKNLVIYNIQLKYIDEEEINEKYDLFNKPENNDLVKVTLLNEVYDVNEEVFADLYEFELKGIDEKGYIIVSRYIDTNLTLMFTLDKSNYKNNKLKNADKIVFVDTNSLLFVSKGKYFLNDSKISEEEYKNTLDVNSLNKNILENDLETTETIQQINNNLLYGIVIYENEVLSISEKSYAGQEKNSSSRYLNTGIYNPYDYAKDKYRGGKIYFSSSKYAGNVSNVTQKSLSSTDKGNCVPASIARLMSFYRSKGYSSGSFSNNTKTNYNNIKHIKRSNGKKYYDYNKGGVSPNYIDNYAEAAFKNANYKKTDAFNIYTWSVSALKRELASRPILMNMNNGYYGGHTVVVDGYRIYKKSIAGIDPSYTFFRISDGWTSKDMWVDMTKFNSSLEVASFTYVRVKK